MKLKKLYILLIISMLITTGCTIDSISPAPVHPAPENIVLGAFEPVVVLNVTVEDDVWDIKFITVQFGTATESIVMERDLLVEVNDEKGETLHRFSKQDPRIVYFEEPPEFSLIEKLPKGKLYVSMPHSPEIQNVWLIGQSLELKDLRVSFDIGDEVKQAYEKFEEQRKINPEEIPIIKEPVIPVPPPVQIPVPIPVPAPTPAPPAPVPAPVPTPTPAPAPPVTKEFTLIIDVKGGGTTDPQSGIKYEAGTVVNLDAIPDDFWKFDRWSGTDNNLIDPTTVTMSSNRTVTAYFTKFYSNNTQLIIARSGINTIGGLSGGKIAVVSGALWDCAVVALDTYGITYQLTIPTGEIYNALQMGVIDAALVAGHPSMSVPEDVNVLGWSDAAIQAVMKAFPNMVATVLPAKTYSGQEYDIPGYAPR